MAQWGLGETRYLKARKSTGSDLEEALSPISTTITSTSNDTNATRSPKSPAQQMMRRTLSTAARTSAGSFSKFRRAMSMRSSESPLAGGDE